MESKTIQLETSHNSLAQYGQQNNIFVSGILNSVEVDILENIVESILSDIDAKVEPSKIETFHRFGK